MANNFNKVMLLGRLVRDPNLSYTRGGTPYARLRMAVNTPYKDKNGNWQEETLFIDVVCWGDVAERAVNRLNSGARIFVEGRLRQSTWETETGERRSRVEVVANKLVFLDSKKETERDIETEEENLDNIEDIEF